MSKNIKHHQTHFLYIDSSEDQDNKQCKHLKPFQLISDGLSSKYYQDSSEQEQSYQKQSVVKTNAHKKTKTTNKICKVKSDKFLHNDEYITKIQEILKENQQKLIKKTPLLLPNTDREMIQNIEKRNKNYGFFLKSLKIDQNYTNILSQKVDKLKKQNQRKKKVLQKKKIKQTIVQDEDQLKKYVIQKKNKEQIVIEKIQKHVHKLQIERVRSEEKKIKQEIKQIDDLNDLKTINLDTKQRNQIYELRQQFEKIKLINRTNRIQQKKALCDMQKNIQGTKRLLVEKVQTAQANKFIL